MEYRAKVDEDDIPFIALSLQLNAVFWTGDGRLKKHLKRHGFVSFFEVEALNNALLFPPD